MREFWILLKTNIVTSFGLNKLKKKFSKKKTFLRVGLPILFIFLIILFMGVSFLYTFMFSQLFIIAELYDGILYLGLGIGALLLVVINLTKANSFLFEAKDNDLLLSLPVKTPNIIASKISNLVIYNYFILLFIFVPTVVIYGIFTAPGILFYLLSLVAFFAFPFIIITVFSVIAYFMNLLMAKMKRKNVFQTVFTIIFFLLVMVGTMFLSTTMQIDLNNEEEIQNIIIIAEQVRSVMQKMYYPNVWLVSGLLGSWLNYVLFILVCFVPFIIFTYVVGKNYIKASARSIMTYTNKNFVLKEEKSSSPIKALVKKELKFLFSNANILLNTAIGPLMSTIMLAIFLFSSGGAFSSPEVADVMDKNTMLAVILFVLLFFSTIVTTTASSISLEGKQLWIIKSAPLKPMQVFKAKIALNLILSIPSIIINAVIVSIVLEASIIYIALFILVPFIYNLIEAMFGLFYNLLFPRLDWDNPLKAAKQGLSVFLSMLNGFVSLVILVVPFILLVSIFNFTIGYVVIILMMFILFAIALILLKTVGVKKYNAISA